MTIRELISLLNNYPDHFDVMVASGTGGLCYTTSVDPNDEKDYVLIT